MMHFGSFGGVSLGFGGMDRTVRVIGGGVDGIELKGN
jgi:hypothetical protein